MNETYSYIEKVIGKNVLKMNSENISFPRYIHNLYEIEFIKILDYECVIVTPKFDRIMIDQLLKQLTLISERTDRIPILELHRLNTEQRHRLISNQFSFVVPNSQLFLPFLFLDFRKEKFKTQRNDTKFSPATQLIFLTIIYSQEEEFTSREIQKITDLTLMTINRALTVLLELDIIKKHGNRSSTYYRIIKSKKEMFNICIEQFINPIKKKIYMDYFPSYFENSLILSGEYALSQISMLSEPLNEQYAIDNESYKILKREYGDNIYYENIGVSNIIEIEVWKYPPFIEPLNNYFRNSINFHSRPIVDFISLYLSLRESKDERIQIELESLLDGMWDSWIRTL